MRGQLAARPRSGDNGGGTDAEPQKDDSEVVDDIGVGETHDEAYHRLRVCMGF